MKNEEKEKKLREELQLHQERIKRSQMTVDQLGDNLKAFDIPHFDPGAIGNISKLQGDNQRLKQLIARAQRELGQTQLPDWDVKF